MTYSNLIGWDFFELLELYNIYVPDNNMEDYEYLVLFIENFVFYKIARNETSKFTKRVISDIKLFLMKLSECKHSYFSNVWKEIAKIDSDFSMLQIWIPLIGNSWC